MTGGSDSPLVGLPWPHPRSRCIRLVGFEEYMSLVAYDAYAYRVVCID